MPPQDYIELVKTEIRHRQQDVQTRHLRSIYFGGGTPSLIPPELIVSVIDELANFGFECDQSTEITIEINPATISQASFTIYRNAGVNRFSVGAQTFNDSLLKLCGREHSAQQTRQTLDLLIKNNCNFSFDLLFALPGQTLSQLAEDLEEVKSFRPPHLSAYCLTVPEGHPMSQGRPVEDAQIEMFRLIEDELKAIELNKYEISNFSQPEKESLHNLSYWRNQSYWGLGLSAHSYFPQQGPQGVRFWNPNQFESYRQQVEQISVGQPFDALPRSQVERLEVHESLTDICHMFLRTRDGLSESVLLSSFSSEICSLVFRRLESLKRRHLLDEHPGRWNLSKTGELLSNRVFSELTFLRQDLENTNLSANNERL